MTAALKAIEPRQPRRLEKKKNMAGQYPPPGGPCRLGWPPALCAAAAEVMAGPADHDVRPACEGIMPGLAGANAMIDL